MKTLVLLLGIFVVIYSTFSIGYYKGQYDQKKACRWPHQDYIEAYQISNSKFQHMRDYVLFQEVQTENLVVISKNALEFSDYETMENKGYFKRIFEGTKRECLEKQDELDLENSLQN